MKDKEIYWLPRILAIIFTICISLFALDAFDGSGFLTVLLSFLIHLFPTYVMLVAIWIAWKKEKVGGYLFLLLGAVFIAMTLGKAILTVYLFISGPLFLIGVLFLWSDKINKKK